MTTSYDTNCERCTARAGVVGNDGHWHVGHDVSASERHEYDVSQRPTSYALDSDLTLRVPWWQHPRFTWRFSQYLTARMLRVFWNRSNAGRETAIPPRSVSEPKTDHQDGDGLPWELREEVD